MKKYLIAGNWKMNFLSSEATNFVADLQSNLQNMFLKNVEVLICSPFVHLQSLQKMINKQLLQLGAQNMHFEPKGAFTGEISPLMLVDAGCDYVILGHSERRQYFGENNEILGKKLKSALEHNLNSIFCIGETLEERQDGKTFDVLNNQLQILHNIDSSMLNKITIAYEPVWAIGTGLNANSEQITEAHSWISKYITDNFANNVRILYGGSMNDTNAREILSCENVDGGLIGGASLKLNSFLNIIQTAIELSN